MSKSYSNQNRRPSISDDQSSDNYEKLELLYRDDSEDLDLFTDVGYTSDTHISNINVNNFTTSKYTCNKQNEYMNTENYLSQSQAFKNRNYDKAKYEISFTGRILNSSIESENDSMINTCGEKQEKNNKNHTSSCNEKYEGHEKVEMSNLDLYFDAPDTQAMMPQQIDELQVESVAWPDDQFYFPSIQVQPVHQFAEFTDNQSPQIDHFSLSPQNYTRSNQHNYSVSNIPEAGVITKPNSSSNILNKSVFGVETTGLCTDIQTPSRSDQWHPKETVSTPLSASNYIPQIQNGNNKTSGSSLHKNQNLKSIPSRYKIINIDGRPREFDCTWPSCNQSFFRKDELRRHIKTVHEKLKPYSCNICNKVFGRKDHLKTHKKTHVRKALKMKGGLKSSNK